MKKRPLLIYTILLFLAVIATYINHFHNGFHFDDSHSVVDNPYIRDIKNIPLFFKDGTTSSVLPQNQSYRPVVSTSLAIDYKLGNGYDLFAFHITTFILFLVQGLLMLIFFKKLLSLSSTNKYIGYVALFATAWYMLHPAIAETINYIIARSDVISTVAVMGGFVLYTNSPFCRKTFLYLIPVGIGALAKPPSVMFAPLLLCYILLFEEKLGLLDIFKKSNLKPLWNSVRKSLPAFVFCALMYLLIDKLTPKTWAPGGNSPIQYLITQPYVILHYFGTFFWPAGLSADSDWAPLSNIWNARFFIGCAFILAMSSAAFYTSQKVILRPISFGILWFFLALIPTSSIIPLGEVLNDHRMYFPFIGLAISVSWTIGLIVFKFISDADHITTKYKVLILTPALLLLCTCAYGTFKRNAVWRDEESLWFNVTVKSPGNGRGMMNYGVIMIEQGKYAEAEKYLNRAMQLAPNYSYVYVNVGVLKENTGDIVAAENNFLESIRLGSGYSMNYFLYGQFLYRRARFIEAEVMLQKSMQLSNSDLRPRELLIKTYALLGQWDLLKNICVTTLKISPGNGVALNGLEESSRRKTNAEIQADKAKVAPTAENYLELSLAYYNEGKYGLCIEAAKKALELKPNYVEAYNNIGCAYNILGQFDKSAEVFAMGLKIKPDYQLAKNNLALSAAHRFISDVVISSQVYTAADYVNQSLNYYNQGQYELSIAACVSALIINPDYDLAYNNLCAAYVKLGQWDDAITVGEKGLKINPNNELLKNNVAQAKWNKKNSKK
ncbi:tetratricopeptide repeat protein [Mucilaginibacter sp. McL0603]|uniref:tetratricopeptide repeat protein n=1 Tax=Mucilaginibacter sp. McL0603 TaxID=3415670 RepID=UPI003CEC0AF4